MKVMVVPCRLQAKKTESDANRKVDGIISHPIDDYFTKN